MLIVLFLGGCAKLGASPQDSSSLRPPLGDKGAAEEYFLLTQKGAEWVYDYTREQEGNRSSGQHTLVLEGEADFDGTKAIRYSSTRISGEKTTGSASYYLARSPEGVLWIGIGGANVRDHFQPPLILLKDPPSVGTIWESKGILTRTGGATGNYALNYSSSVTVLREERVVVPAGEFDVIVTRAVTEWKSSQTDLRNTIKTEWRARKIGKVKEVSSGPLDPLVPSSPTYHIVYELRSYSLPAL